MKNICLVLLCVVVPYIASATNFHVVKLVQYPNGRYQLVSTASQAKGSKTIIPFLEISNSIGELDHAGEFKFGHWTGHDHKGTTTWSLDATKYQLNDIIAAYNHPNQLQPKDTIIAVCSKYKGDYVKFLNKLTVNGVIYNSQKKHIIVMEKSNYKKTTNYLPILLIILFGIIYGKIVYQYGQDERYEEKVRYTRSSSVLEIKQNTIGQLLLYSWARIFGSYWSIARIVTWIIVSCFIPLIWIAFLISESIQFHYRYTDLKNKKYITDDDSLNNAFLQAFHT